RLGSALREAETVGIPWDINPDGKSKHLRKDADKRTTIVAPHAVAAIRLLLFTGSRLREILNLTWKQVDLDRGLLLIAEHKSRRTQGTKTIVLNAPALSVLSTVPRLGK